LNVVNHHQIKGVLFVCRLTVCNVLLAKVHAKRESVNHVVVTRTRRDQLNPLNVVNAHQTRIFPSGCTARSFTTASPKDHVKLGSVTHHFGVNVVIIIVTQLDQDHTHMVYVQADKGEIGWTVQLPSTTTDVHTRAHHVHITSDTKALSIFHVHHIHGYGVVVINQDNGVVMVIDGIIEKYHVIILLPVT
jgi:hypothetical protein